MLNRFLRNQDGNFSQMFALALLPLMLGAGAAVDYSSVSRDKTMLQNSLDTGILAVGIDFPSMSSVQVQKIIREYMESNMSPGDFGQIKNINVKPDVNGRSLQVTATGQFDTNFMQLAGIKKIDYQAEAEIKAASGGAEIAFVLDNTNSMNSDGKLAALKTAATNFTNAIMKKATGGDFKIGIVPFSNHVNVGLANRSASWLEVEDDSTTTDPNYCYMKTDLLSSTNCQDATGYSDGVPYTYQQCDNTYSDPYEVCEPRTTTTVWNGCVGSREYPYNLEDRGFGARRVPGLMNTWCGAEITPLTNIKSDVTDQIDAMSGSGETYIPAGLTWGMRMLSNAVPYTQAVTDLSAKKNDINKYLVLMTDGDNTKSAQLPGSPAHWGSDVDEANAWTSEACQNIKDEGITVFTITFGTLLAATKTLIEECASSSSNYFHAATGDELNAAFEGIRGQIAALHLSR